MVTDDINAKGGLLGRPLELYIEDTGSEGRIGESSVRRLIEQRRVDVVLGGVTSAMRNAIKDVIVTEGRTLYVYPTLYEGTECTPYLFCTGPTPAQQCDHFIPWLIANGGKRFALPAADYVWPRKLNEYARQVIERSGGEVVFEEYYPFDQFDHSATVNRIVTEDVDVVFYTVIPPGVEAFVTQLYEAGFQGRGGRLACPYYDDNAANLNAPSRVGGLGHLSRLLPGAGEQRRGPVHGGGAGGVRRAVPGQGARMAMGVPFHVRPRYRRDVSQLPAVGGGGQGGGQRRARRSRRRPRSRADRARSGRAGGDGPRHPPLPHEHVHRRRQEGEFEIAWRSPGLLDPKACV